MTITIDSTVLIGRIMDIAEGRCPDKIWSYFNWSLAIMERKAASESKKIKAFAVRIRSAARSIRSAVRQSFTARTAAKAGDDGGGDSDPEPRHQHQHQHRNTQQHHLNKAVSTILCGGAK